MRMIKKNNCPSMCRYILILVSIKMLFKSDVKAKYTSNLNLTHYSLYEYFQKYGNKIGCNYKLISYIFNDKIYLSNEILYFLGYNNNYFKKRQSVLCLLKNHKEIIYKTEKINKKTYCTLKLFYFKKLCKLVKNKDIVLNKINLCQKFIVSYKKYIIESNKKLQQKIQMITNCDNISKFACLIINNIINFQNNSFKKNFDFLTTLIDDIYKLIIQIYSHQLSNLQLLSNVGSKMDKISILNGINLSQLIFI